MKPATTITLVAVAGLGFSYLWFVDQKAQTTQDKLKAASKVAVIQRDKINAITITNDGKSIEIKKTGSNWSMESPLKDRAEASAVNSLISAVEFLKQDDKIEADKARLAEFGVSESKLRVTLAAEGGARTELVIGKDTPIKNKIYVHNPAENSVYVVSNTLRDEAKKDSNDFREKKLADFTASQVKKIEIVKDDKTLELSKTGTHWDILKPLTARAGDPKVADFLGSLLNAQTKRFMEAKDTEENGLSKPAATVSFTVEGQDKPVTLKVGKAGTTEADKDATFVQISNRDAVLIVPNTALGLALNPVANDVRDKKIVRVEADTVDRITVKPVGAEPFTIARKGESWVRKDGDKDVAINESVARRLIDDLRNTEVTNFAADSAEDLAKFNLKEPAYTVTLSSFATENTAETKRANALS